MPEKFKPNFPLQQQKSGGNRRRGRGNKGNRSRSNSKRNGSAGNSKAAESNWNSTKPSGNTIPKDLTGSVILFDNDDFYGVYLDLLIFDFNKGDLVRIETLGDFEIFKKHFTSGVYKQNIYIVDELFGWGEVDIPKLVNNLRIIDKEAYVLGATALTDGAIANSDIYNGVVVKSKGTHEKSIIKELARKFNVEINVNSDDPEHREGFI